MLMFNVDRLRAERVAKRLTQKQMAMKLGISRNAYLQKEKGQRDIGIDEFSKILKILGYSKNEMSVFFTQNVDRKEQKESTK